MRSIQRLLRGKDGAPLSAGNITLLQYLVKPFPVLCGIHTIGGRAQNSDPHIRQSLGQLNGSLPAKLNHRPPGLLLLYDILHIFSGQRLKVKLVSHVKIGGNCLRVIVDNDRLTAQLFQRPYRVNRAIVKFDPLTDTDGAGA